MTDISIIIPAYNAEKQINKCLQSLINQTKKEIEIIVLNDGSKDNTEEVIKSIEDKRINYYKHDNKGIGKTRNIGIEKATGKYIMFLDSDDYIAKDMCEKLFIKAESNKLDIVVCDFYKEFTSGIIEEIHTPSFQDASLKENPEIITEFLCPWAKLYNRKMIIDNQIKFPENLKYEDVPFVIEALDYAKKIGKVDECLYYYLIHGNSETTIVDKRVFDIIKIIDIVRCYSKDKGYLKDRIDRLTVRILTNYTIQQRNQIEKDKGKEFINKAFDYLEKEVPNYRNNKYYVGRGLLRRTIEKSRFLTNLYCNLYKKGKQS